MHCFSGKGCSEFPKSLHYCVGILRNFRTLKERWLYSLDSSQIQSLDELNRLIADYIRRHNTTKHSGTGQTPLERYLASNERIRKPVSKEWLEEAFHNRVIRNVNKDATIHLSNASYDAPMQFIGQKVEVRFRRAHISCTEDSIIPWLTDRVANGRTKRRAALSIDYAKEGTSDVH